MFTSVSNYVYLNNFTRADSEGLCCNVATFDYIALFILEVVEMSYSACRVFYCESIFPDVVSREHRHWRQNQEQPHDVVWKYSPLISPR